MRLAGKELFRVMKCPVLYLVFAAFLSFNIFTTHLYIEEGNSLAEWRSMHQAVLAHGVSLAGVKGQGPGETMELYQSYVEQYKDLYEDLDILSVLREKERLTDYHPSGSFGDFIDNNYRKLQDRVQEIQRSGEGEYGFYPGRLYGVHRMLYQKIGQDLLVQMVVLTMLCVLLLMDYERIHGTRDTVLATRTGKGIMGTKAVMGMISGLVYSILLMAGTYLYFFGNISLDGLWDIPLASSIMAEPRGPLMYPFVTFWEITEKQYFWLVNGVYLILVVLAAMTAAALQMLIQNSYFSFLLQCLVYMFSYRLACWQNGTFTDLMLALFDPVELWSNCGGWFMENDPVLSFAGNEFLCLACHGTVVMILLLLGRSRYKRLEC